MASAPDTIDRYRVERPLDDGRLGSTFAVVDPADGTLLALETVRNTSGIASRWSGPEAALRATEHLRDELNLLIHLRHPNLVAIRDVAFSGELGCAYVVREAVDGPTLVEVLAKADRATIVGVFVQLARAIDHVHAVGLVQGVLDPGRVRVVHVDGQPRAKIMDVGSVRISQATLAADHGEAAASLTPVSDEAADRSADIHALARAMHTAVLGAPPDDARDPQAMRAAEDAIAARAGPVVAELLRRMLDPDPERRPQTARGIVLELLRRESPQALRGEDEEEERRQLTQVLLEQVPFVDRGGHLAALLELAGAGLVPGAEVTRCVLIEAPKGLGKRTLMAELRRDLQLRGQVFLDISAWDDHEGLGAFSGVVTQLSTALPQEAQDSFARLFEIVRDRRGESIEASSMVDFLLASAARRPFVLHFAELARSTEFARQVFEQLARAVAHYEAPMLLCATAVPHPKLTRVTQQLQREGLLEIRALRPFSSADTRALTRGIFADSPMIGPLAELLDDLTGGHPLGVRETLRLLLEESIVAREGGDWVLHDSRPAAETLHETLAERTEARIDGIGVAAWELAATLHLVGASVQENVLAELADLRPGRFGRMLERLEAEGLITRIATGAATEVTLAHRSVHEAVRRRYAASLDETRMDLAARIEELETDDPRLLFLRGKLLDDASSTLETVETLEGLFGRLCELGQARLGALLLDRVIGRRRAHGGLEGAGRLLETILMLLQQAGGALEDSREETAHYEAGVLLAQLLGNHRAEALLCLGLADRFVGDSGEDVERELGWLERAAQAVALARDRRLELRIANRRAEILVTIGQIEEATQQSAKAMEMLEMESPADVDVSNITGVRIRCLTFAGQFEEAKRLHELGKPIAARVPVVQRQAYLSGISLLASSFDPSLAIPELVAGIEQLRGAGAARLLRTPIHNLGDLYLSSGQLAPAAECFREALGLAVLHGIDYDAELNRGFLGYTLARLGQVEHGAELLSAAKKKMYALVGEHFGSHQLRILASEVRHLLGHTARARQELEEAAAEFSAERQQSLARLARAALGRIEADVGKP